MKNKDVGNSEHQSRNLRYSGPEVAAPRKRRWKATRQKDEEARRGGSGACDLYPGKSWLPNAVSA